jgi:hypothetical protein
MIPLLQSQILMICKNKIKKEANIKKRGYFGNAECFDLVDIIASIILYRFKLNDHTSKALILIVP